MRAAANSIARGSPSSRRQIEAMATALVSVSWKSGLMARARWRKSATAAYSASVSHASICSRFGSARGGTWNSYSPCTCKTARLVTSIFNCGQRLSNSTNCGAACTSRSKLSSTSSSCLSPRAICSRSSGEHCSVSFSPNDWMMVGMTSAESRSAASETNTTPFLKSAPSSAATRRASRVFPIPPAPVSVTRRTSGLCRCALTHAASSSRPTSGVSGSGRVSSRKVRISAR